MSERCQFAFYAEGVPQPKGSFTRMHGRMFPAGTTNSRKKKRDWEASIVDAILERRETRVPIASTVAVTVSYYFPIPAAYRKTIDGSTRPHHTLRPDLDKLDRALFDALTKSGIISDDSRIYRCFSSKHWTDGEPGAAISIFYDSD